MPARVEIRGTREFRLVAARLRAAGNGELRRELGRNMRAAAEPVITAMRQAVMATDSAGVRGGGGQQRREFTVGRARKSTERIKRRAAAGRGLRATVGRTLRTKMSTGARSTRVEIRSQAKLMPPSQRRLPRHMNTGKWRHPVMGNREVWVGQTVSPPGWFDRPANRGGRKIRASAVDVVNNINRKIAA